MAWRCMTQTANTTTSAPSLRKSAFSRTFQNGSSATPKMKKNQYFPVSATDKEDEKDGIDWNSSSEIIPSNTKAFILYLSMLLISLSANVLFILHIPSQSSGRDMTESPYSGNTFDTLSPYYFRTDYWNPALNQSDLNENWDALDTSPMTVALHNDFVQQEGLLQSIPFPWDKERSVYYLKGFQSLQCLKLIRKAIITSQNGDRSALFDDHIFSCLDGLRQDIMCLADDTPIPVTSTQNTEDGQPRQCRSWNKLKAWATRPDVDACHQFDNYSEATKTVELFRFCPHDHHIARQWMHGSNSMDTRTHTK